MVESEAENVGIQKVSALLKKKVAVKQGKQHHAKSYLELEKEIEDNWFKIETKIIKKTVPRSKWEKFQEIDGVLYYTGRIDEFNRLQTRDLDLQIFFDQHEFSGKMTVVRANSPLAYAYVIHVHFHELRHAGNEFTKREILKKMFIMDKLTHLVKRVRADCVTCRMIMQKTVDLVMAKHNFARTMIAPCFYNSMCDIAYGFRAKPYQNSRKTYKIYALIVVCMLTSATNILVLESIETQEVVAAIERHSARYSAGQLVRRQWFSVGRHENSKIFDPGRVG